MILNWNGRAMLERFLPDVVQHSPAGSVVVADNASTDDSLAWLAAHFPGVGVVRLPRNLGYSGGYQAALTQVAADYYILLNSDVAVGAGWWQPLVAWLAASPQHGACQPKILDYNAPHQFEYAGAAGGYLDRWGYPFCRGRLFDLLEDDQGQYDDAVEIFWATGACLALRAEAYWAVGGLDPDFFAHMEEIDLCWRLWRAGYRVAYRPESAVWHVGGGSLAATNPLKTRLNFRNGLVLMLKNLPADQLVWRLLGRMMLDGVAALRWLLAGEPRHFVAVWQAHRQFYATWRRHWRKRSALPASGWPPGTYPGSVVRARFVRGVKKFSQLRWTPVRAIVPQKMIVPAVGAPQLSAPAGFARN